MFVWLLIFSLPRGVEHTGTVVPASTALGMIIALKLDHYVKVAALSQSSRDACAPVSENTQAVALLPATSRNDQDQQADIQLPLMVVEVQRGRHALAEKPRSGSTNLLYDLSLYGCQTWSLRLEDIRKLEAFDQWCSRTILKVKWMKRVSNEQF